MGKRQLEMESEKKAEKGFSSISKLRGKLEGKK